MDDSVIEDSIEAREEQRDMIVQLRSIDLKDVDRVELLKQIETSAKERFIVIFKTKSDAKRKFYALAVNQRNGFLSTFVRLYAREHSNLLKNHGSDSFLYSFSLFMVLFYLLSSSFASQGSKGQEMGPVQRVADYLY